MENSKKMYWVAQICGWSIYSLLIYFSATIDRPTEISSNLHLQLVFMTVFNIFFTHIMRLYMLRNNWLDKKLAQLLPRLIIISIICSAFIECCLLVSEYFLSDNFYNDLKPAQVIINILALTLLIISWNGIYFTYHFFQKSRVKELENVTLEASKNEIELKNLRSQLNPHFLFNFTQFHSFLMILNLKMLNAIAASNLLRKSLVSGKENLIPVSEEVEIVKSYPRS
ncbi:MAG: histidine kinase [Crocinitomicaceae bacterium]